MNKRLLYKTMSATSRVYYIEKNNTVARDAARMRVLLLGVAQSGIWYTAKLTWVMARATFNERRTIREMRKYMAECHEQCDNAACMFELYESIKGIRDAYVSMVKCFSQLPRFLHLHKKHAEKMLIDWDDLVEDCFISSDPEIRTSISRIAKLC